jgi:hypothetical protein
MRPIAIANRMYGKLNEMGLTKKMMKAKIKSIKTRKETIEK